MITTLLNYVKENATELVLLGIGLIIAFLVGSFLIVQKETNNVFRIDEDFPQERVGIVFGAGFTDEGPLEPLRDRLTTAAELYERGDVEKLLLSGDNRTLDYNEPQVMEDFLVERGIPRRALQQDLAGRSTYETCERAAKVFGLNSAILISQETHLPRALYLSGHFGIDGVGVVAEGSGSSPRRFIAQSFREIPARAKAVFNAQFIGENTILGEPINL
jgi:vancomycin permeability regulator SanA